jgi:hypothetical protein
VVPFGFIYKAGLRPSVKKKKNPATPPAGAASPLLCDKDPDKLSPGAHAPFLYLADHAGPPPGTPSSFLFC